MNSVQLIGRLTKDAERRDTAEVEVAVLRLAVPRRRDDSEPVYVDVVCFARQAITASEYLRKGRLVGVLGRLEYRQWTSASGARRSGHEIVADQVDYLDPPPVAAEATSPDAS
jgi:single-strand DNA-binding protein